MKKLVLFASVWSLATSLVAQTIIEPEIGDVQLSKLQATDGTDGDLITDSVIRTFKGTTSSSGEAWMSLGMFFPNDIHKISVVTGTSGYGSIGEAVFSVDSLPTTMNVHKLSQSSDQQPFRLYYRRLSDKRVWVFIKMERVSVFGGQLRVTYHSSRFDSWDESGIYGLTIEHVDPNSLELMKGQIETQGGTMDYPEFDLNHGIYLNDNVTVNGSLNVNGKNVLTESSLSDFSLTGPLAVGSHTNTSSIGEYAGLFGRDSEASGDYSFAAGWQTKATGRSSIALGAASEASGEYSVALGNGTSAVGTGSLAAGINSEASGYGSTALGLNSQASNQGSIAFGDHAVSSGRNTIAIGAYATASGLNSVAIGSSSKAESWSSFAAAGGEALGDRSVAIGSGSKAEFNKSFAVAGGKALGESSVAIGFDSKAESWGAFAAAGGEAKGMASSAIGYGTLSYGVFNQVLGFFNDPKNGAMSDEYSYHVDGHIFSVGNGSAGRSNALLIKLSGETTITNKHWDSANPKEASAEDDYGNQGEALIVEGHSELKGNTIVGGDLEVVGALKLSSPQGDISMGIFGE